MEFLISIKDNENVYVGDYNVRRHEITDVRIVDNLNQKETFIDLKNLFINTGESLESVLTELAYNYWCENDGQASDKSYWEESYNEPDLDF